jgi:hypothetical protein
MKPLCNSVSRLWLVSSFCLAISGCNTGNVQVGSDGPASAAPGTQTQTTPAPSVPSGNSQTDSTGASQQENQVYFERVESTGGLPDKVIGVSFASEDTTTTTPDGLALKSPAAFSPSANFFPGVNQIVCLQSNGLFSNSLSATSIDTMLSQSVFDFPRATNVISMDSSQNLVAWIDLSGTVSVSSLALGTTESISLSGDSAVLLSLSASGNQLLVRTASGAAITFTSSADKGGAGTWNQVLNIPSVSAAAFSPDGKQLVYVNDRGLFTVGTDRSDAVGALQVSLESAQIYDLAWNAGNVVSYWTRLQSGAGEIRVVNLASDSGDSKKDGQGSVVPHSEHLVVAVNMPAAVTDGVVCPAWNRDHLYFGDYTDGKYLIEKAARGKGAVSGVAAFAIPFSAYEGFVCPKVLQGVAKK